MTSLLNTINDYIVILDKKGNIKFCNKSLLCKLNYNKVDNLEIENILSERSSSIFRNVLELNKNKSFSQKHILCFKDKDNKIINLDSTILSGVYKDEEVVFICSNVEAETPFNKKDIEFILDSIPSKVCIKGDDNRCIYVNQKYASMINSSKEEILGEKISSFWGKDDCQKLIDIEEKAKKEKKPFFREESLELNGKNIDMEIYKAPMFDEYGNFKYMITLLNDITIIKNIDKEIRKNNDRILELIHNNGESINIDNVINTFTKDIFDHLNVNCLSMYLYDKKNNSLKLKSRQGQNLLSNIRKSEILEVDLKEVSKVHGLISVKELDQKTQDLYAKNNIKLNFLGVYQVVVDGEFMGILHTSYLDDNYPKCNNDVFINAMCSKLGLIIKNHLTSNELKEEFNKRVEVEKNLKRILDISVDMITTIRWDGSFEDVSPQWEKTLGWTKEELHNINFLDLVHIDYQDEIIEVAFKKDINARRIVIKILAKDNNYKWFELNIKYILDENKFIATLRDITKDKEEENALKMLRKTIELESIKNEFFANISHEFRTPLNIILGSIQLFEKRKQENKITSEKKSYLDSHVKSIKQNSYRLLKLVNNIIDMTRIDTGYYKLELGNYNIVAIVEDITLSVAEYIKNKGINLIFDTNSEDTQIACDPDKIERIMLNLLSNAIKYNSKDGEIFVNINVKSDKVVISVKDNGDGIEKEKLPLIFERFTQADDVLTRRCEGSGIGLSLVKSLVEMHGGNVYAYSEPDEGTTIEFELPRVLVENNTNTSDGKINNYKVEKCEIEFSDIYSI